MSTKNLGKHRNVPRVNLPQQGATIGGQTALGEPTTAQRLPTTVVPPPSAAVVATTTTSPAGVEVPALAITWAAPNPAPASYDVELTRPDGVVGERVAHNSQALLDNQPQGYVWLAGLLPGTNYTVRVRSVLANGQLSAWTIATPNPVTTPRDTTPPGAFQSITADWATADLIMDVLTPLDADMAAILVTIEPAGGGTLYTSWVQPAGPNQTVRLVWRLADNRAQAGGVPTARVSLTPRDAAGNLGPTAVLTPVNPVPPNITGLAWEFDGQAIVISWTPVGVGDLAYYAVEIETANPTAKTYPTPTPSFRYEQDQRILDHNGANVGTVPFNVVAVDVFGQVSETPESATAINEPPENVENLVAQFTGRDAVFSWDAVDDSDLDYYQVIIDDVLQPPVRDTRLVYTFAKNSMDHGGVRSAMVQLTMSVRAVDSVGQGSPTPTSVTVINAAPGQPGNLRSPWLTDRQRAPADLVARWDYSFPEDFSHFVIYFGAVEMPRQTTAEITITEQQIRALPPPAGKAVRTNGFLVIYAVDAFDQPSTPRSVELANFAPPAILATDLTLRGSGERLDVEIAGAVLEAKDLAAYVITLLEQEREVQTVRSSANVKTLTLPRPGIYRVRLYAEDVYGQRTAAVSSTVYVADWLTLAELRDDVTYRDSRNRTSPELDVLKDGRAGASILY
jgi:hypothetical protein